MYIYTVTLQSIYKNSYLGQYLTVEVQLES